MTDDRDQRRRGIGGIRTARMEAFSDGVFAIAITLLVLDLSVPADPGDHLLDTLWDEWPSYLAYVVSFSTIGAIWLGHSVVTEYLERADATMLRLNLLLLLVVGFLPFPTKLFAEYIDQDDPERVATTLYGVTLLMASIVLSLMWRYAARSRLIRSDVADEDVQILSRRITPGLGGYGLLIALGLFAPVVAVFGYFVIAVFLMLPFRALRRRRPQAQS